MELNIDDLFLGFGGLKCSQAGKDMNPTREYVDVNTFSSNTNYPGTEQLKLTVDSVAAARLEGEDQCPISEQ